MDTVDEKKYINGRKKFWAFVILSAIQNILASFAVGLGLLVDFIPEALLLFLLYRGYIWVWYYDVIRAVVTLFLALRMIIVCIPNIYWIIYVYPPLFIIYIVVGVIITIAISIILIFKNDLRYFVKINQLKRKGA